MAYTTRNFPTKKALKNALAGGDCITVFNPGLGPNLDHYTGTVFLEGPHKPKPHTWYAQATVRDGYVEKVS